MKPEEVTRKDIESWAFIEKTPASGKCYHSAELDMTGTVYPKHCRVFYNRTSNVSNSPHVFEDELQIEEGYYDDY